MRLAFYAPLKSPNHPVPSGDRTIARGLLDALALDGHRADLASELRIHDKFGDASVQAALQEKAQAEVTRILKMDAARDWQAWITYHNYYKAPDLIAPTVCEALEIPYYLIEATRAKKRLTGPWARFAEAAERASDRARRILYFTERDAEALRRDAPYGQDIQPLAPFLNRSNLPRESSRNGSVLCVGMMRAGDKMASYALIAETLLALPDMDWHCDIVGDGPARADVEALFARFGSRVRLLGALSSKELEEQYANASCFFWPGVNEAFGMVYLEAQAAGLPIVAQDRPGVCDVVELQRTSLKQGATGLAARLEYLLADRRARDDEGQSNRERVKENHLLPPTARVLSQTLEAN